MQNKVTKETRKQLEEIAANLPHIPVAHKKRMTGKDYLELVNAQFKDIDTTTKEYDVYRERLGQNIFMVPFSGAPQAVNHLKRITSAYIGGGWEAVDKYCVPYKLSGKTESQKLEEVSQELNAPEEPVKRKRGRPRKESK